MKGEDPRTRGLTAFVADARWFGGKGREFTITDVRDLALADGVTTTLLTVTFDDGATEVYQVPISSYDEPQDRIGHALIGDWDDQFHYDGVHDREAMQGWLTAFAAAAPEKPHGAFHRTGDHELDLESHSTLFSGEQSNSSVAFGEDSLMKVFRRVTAGQNPDIEIHEALTRAESTHVAALYGYVADNDLHLAMLQQFLRTASDGWDLALVSARNLFAEADLHADEVGGDFAAEAHRLGVAVAEVHQLLAAEFPCLPLDLAGTARAMQGRLSAAVGVVPELAAQQKALAQRFDTVAALGRGAAENQLAQRIHGDLHLGQTLRTSLGWKLVDFEGEPAKDLDERRLPDSPWRDVAGMLRSFDYAVRAVVRDVPGTEEESGQIAYRAEEWVRRNTASFVDGYVEARGRALTDDEWALVTAYVADKAVYEAVYETRNRPTWADIPLAALRRLAHGPADGLIDQTSSFSGTEPQ
jgi:maltokinase